MSHSALGYNYQVKFLMLFALRGRRYYNFNLATEMDLAEGFDDVVFETVDSEKGENLTWHFLQVKHSTTNEKLQLGDLESTLENSEFSLLNYFMAYCNIKEQHLFNNPPSSHKFAIVSNRHSDLDRKDVKVGNMVCSIEVDTLNEDDILYFESGHNKPFAAKKYKLKHKRSSYSSPFNKQTIDTFFDEFYFVTDYPDEVELGKLIENELCQNEKIDKNNIYLVNGALNMEMWDLFSQEPADYYTKRKIDNFFEEMSLTFGKKLSNGADKIIKCTATSIEGYAENKNNKKLSLIPNAKEEKIARVKEVLPSVEEEILPSANEEKSSEWRSFHGLKISIVVA